MLTVDKCYNPYLFLRHKNGDKCIFGGNVFVFVLFARWQKCISNCFGSELKFNIMSQFIAEK